jgi:CRISPR-associated protein Csd1
VPGYSSEKIAYGVTLAADGSVIDVVPLGEMVKGKHVPKAMIVPQPPAGRTSGIRPCLLWDKTLYAFGATDPNKESKRAAKKGVKPGVDEFTAFRIRQHEEIGDTDDPGLRAFLIFLDGWDPDRYDSLPNASGMLDTNVIFRLDGEDWLHNKPAGRAIVGRSMGGKGTIGFCLVTGAEGPIALTHDPKIKGVRGAQSSGAAIVSFNQSAFTSYGKEQGENAPVSEYAAFAYTTALNALLAERRNRVRIGDASVVFWAEPEEGEDAYDAESIFAGIFGGGAGTSPEPEAEPSPDAGTQERDLLNTLKKIAEGRPVPGLSINPATKFYVLGLSPNAARISVRFWLETTIQQLAEKLTRHFEDLRLEPPAWRGGNAPKIWQLVYCLAPVRRSDDGRIKDMTRDEKDRFEKSHAHIAGELTRAILTGARYPVSIISMILMRFRVDREIAPLRVALIKAMLSRMNEEVSVSIDFEERNAGYRLGRLFGILERLQAAALGRKNATVRDKFYASASATPARIFPSLIRNAKNHSKSVRSKVGAGLSEWFEDRISEVLSGPSTAFPTTLRLEDQGRFAIGYYHQREAFINKTAAAPAELEAAENVDVIEE